MDLDGGEAWDLKVGFELDLDLKTEAVERLDFHVEVCCANLGELKQGEKVERKR